jgi:uncharacterized protein (DUF2141 family)
MMKTKALLFLATISMMASCAQRGMPTGGPKDEEPPVLVQTLPAHESLNFKGKEVIFTFDEYVQGNNLEKELTISPRIDQKYKTNVLKNRLEIKFEKPLEEKTTYIFELNQAIKDVTEGNLAENPKLAFSTGSTIDTLKIKGQVKKYMTQQPMEGAIVAVYKAGDTTDLFNAKPLYFTKTDAQGNYLISYLKAGEYRLYTFNDKNSDLQCNATSEGYGFHHQPLKVSVQQEPTVDLQLYQLNSGELDILSSRPTAQYFEVRLNKPVTDFQLKPLEPKQKNVKIFSNLQESNKVIRVYQSKELQKFDSLTATVFAIDSVSNVVEDTVHIKFFEDREAPADFISSFSPKTNTPIVEEFVGKFTFSKPIATVNADSVFFQYDSLTVVPVNMKKDAEWNKHKDQLTIRKTLDRSKVTVKTEETPAMQPKVEEKPAENVDKDVDNKLNRKRPKFEENKENEKNAAQKSKTINFAGKVRFYAAKGSFMSVENDSSNIVDNFYTFKESKDYATIKGQIQTKHKHFIIQLLDKDYKIVDEIQDEKNYAFNFVSPGDYYVRVLVDNNDNGIWEYGNILKMEAPEDVLITEQQISLRENWEVGDINFKF